MTSDSDAPDSVSQAPDIADDHERAQLEAAVAARTHRQAQIATRLETLAASAEHPD